MDRSAMEWRPPMNLNLRIAARHTWSSIASVYGICLKTFYIFNWSSKDTAMQQTSRFLEWTASIRDDVETLWTRDRDDITTIFKQVVWLMYYKYINWRCASTISFANCIFHLTSWMVAMAAAIRLNIMVLINLNDVSSYSLHLHIPSADSATQ